MQFGFCRSYCHYILSIRNHSINQINEFDRTSKIIHVEISKQNGTLQHPENIYIFIRI